MRVSRIVFLFLAVFLALIATTPAGAASPWKRQMRIGLYHLGVPRQFHVSSADGPLEVYDPFSRRVLLSGPASGATVICQNGQMQVFMAAHGSVSAPYPLVFSSLGSKQPFLRVSTPPYRGETYRGSLAIAPWRDRLFAVNLVDIEEYLRSVVPAEIGGNAPAAALEAQAVAARSYALRNHQRHGPNGFDLCDEVHCQVYRGLRTETPTSGQAVLRTAGWALTYGSYIANTVYHANCGGRLASSQAVWKGAPVPYLSEHPDCIGNSHFFCAPENRKAGTAKSKSTPGSPKGSSKLVSGKSKTQPEKAPRLSLRAATGVPYHPSRGHRVGLCQDGAIGMAKRGYNAVAIMNFYYPGTVLCPIQSNLQLARLTKSPGSPATPPAAPRFGSGKVRLASSIRKRSPARQPVQTQHLEASRKSSEPTPFALNLRKWFWTALSPHSSVYDSQIVTAGEITSAKKKRGSEPKKKILLTSATKASRKGGDRNPGKSTRRNARR